MEDGGNSSGVQGHPGLPRLLETLSQNNQDGEVVQQLRTLAALAEDLGWVPSTHIVDKNGLWGLERWLRG